MMTSADVSQTAQCSLKDIKQDLGFNEHGTLKQSIANISFCVSRISFEKYFDSSLGLDKILKLFSHFYIAM